jgi:hypothetical protein
VDELSHYTKRLTSDRVLWQRMSVAARRRARDFSRERFVQQLSRACHVEP